MPGKIPYHQAKHVIAYRRAVESDPRRKEDKAFYCSTRWRKLRAAFLADADHALCAQCRREGRVTAAVHVHHKIPRKQDLDRAFDWDNLVGLCVPCHTRHEKTGQ